MPPLDGHIQEWTGGAGGSNGGRGGKARAARGDRTIPGSVMTRTSREFGGSGGGGGRSLDRQRQSLVGHETTVMTLGGYSDENKCMPSHGGAGGGAFKIGSIRGSVYIGRAVISLDGASVYGPGVAGGGAGGTLSVYVHGGADITVSKEAVITARGGYTRPMPPNVWDSVTGEDALGGGGRVRFGRAPGTGKLQLRYWPKAFSLSSGAHACPSATDPSITGQQYCDCQPSLCGYQDGKIFILDPSNVDLTDSALDLYTGSDEVPDSISGFAGGPNESCVRPRMVPYLAVAAPAGYSTSTGCCLDPAGGQTFSLSVASLFGETWRHNLSETVDMYVGGIPMTDVALVSISGTRESSTGFTANAKLPPLHGAGLNVSVRTTYGGQQRLYTVDAAYTSTLPSIEEGIFEAPPLHARWTNTTATPYQWSFVLKGSHLGSTGNPQVRVTIGGQDCRRVHVINATAVRCHPMSDIGEDRPVKVYAAEREASGTMNTISFSPPIVFAASRSQRENATIFRYYAVLGGERITFKGVNFGVSSYLDDEGVSRPIGHTSA